MRCHNNNTQLLYQHKYHACH